MVSIVRSSCIVVDSDDVLVVVVVAGDVVAVVKFSVSSSSIYVVVKTLLAPSFIVFIPYKPLGGLSSLVHHRTPLYQLIIKAQIASGIAAL